MGYSPGLLDMIVEWSKQFDIRPGARVLDIGTQELFCADDPASLNRFTRGMDQYSPAPRAGWCVLRPVDCVSDHKQIA
jgi:hypothetical protein